MQANTSRSTDVESTTIPRLIVRAPRLKPSEMALPSDPDWESELPEAPKLSVRRPKVPSESKHPVTKEDFQRLEDCGHLLAHHLGWGALQGVAIREAGQIAAQRYGFAGGKDQALAEEAFSLLMSAL